MKNLLCVAIMVKNEAGRIERTLSSVIDFVDHVVVLDTGSTDNTIEVIKNYCHMKKKPLKLKELAFVDFSYNRNYLLKMCHTLTKFILLMDANEECRNMEALIHFLKRANDARKDIVFNCRYDLRNDSGVTGNDQTFYKICVIRNDVPELHYEFPVHEYIICDDISKFELNNDLLNTGFHMYQDRKLDKPSTDRFPKDIAMLLKYIEKHGENLRAYRYLVQSYRNIHDYPNAIIYCDKLINYCEKHLPITSKYFDEYYAALLGKGYSYGSIGNEDFYKWMLKAYQYSKLLYDNAEPFVITGQLYVKFNLLKLAHAYFKKACAIPIPPNNLTDCVINYQLYHKVRWECLAKCAYDVNELGDHYKALEMLGQCK